MNSTNYGIPYERVFLDCNQQPTAIRYVYNQPRRRNTYNRAATSSNNHCNQQPINNCYPDNLSEYCAMYNFAEVSLTEEEWSDLLEEENTPQTMEVDEKPENLPPSANNCTGHDYAPISLWNGQKTIEVSSQQSSECSDEEFPDVDMLDPSITAEYINISEVIAREADIFGEHIPC